MIQLNHPNGQIQGEITLNGSKSIANRALIIQALCNEDFVISKLSNSKDTTTLQTLLLSQSEFLDAGPAGTTFRFMTAYLALQDGEQILTGSERMKQRPIGVLVDALRELGGDIEYLENEGYPPLKIKRPKKLGENNVLKVPSNISSQFISALLMIGPVLPQGLKLIMEGDPVSIPYIEMTLNLMAYFGIRYEWKKDTITIKPQSYQAKDYKVEADWSAASYYYAIAAFADQLDLQLNGLWEESVQGDSVVAEMMEKFGIKSTFNQEGVQLRKSGRSNEHEFQWDFINCPDIAQTLAVICAGLGVKSRFSGLQTLKIKETDRIAALQTELKKVKVHFFELPNHSNQSYCLLDGKADVRNPIFATYEDHRMAMAFAPFALFGKVRIEEPGVVVKSYPDFWKDLEKIGFSITEVG